MCKYVSVGRCVSMSVDECASMSVSECVSMSEGECVSMSMYEDECVTVSEFRATIHTLCEVLQCFLQTKYTKRCTVTIINILVLIDFVLVGAFSDACLVQAVFITNSWIRI